MIILLVISIVLKLRASLDTVNPAMKPEQHLMILNGMMIFIGVNLQKTEIVIILVIVRQNVTGTIVVRDGQSLRK